MTGALSRTNDEPGIPGGLPLVGVTPRPRLHVRKVLLGWILASAGLLAAAALLPGLRIERAWGAFGVAAAVGILNASIVPAVARIRLPFTLLTGFVVVLLLDAAVLWIAADIVSGTVTVDSFGWAIAGALVAAAATLALQVLFGVNNDDTYSLRVTERMARRSGKQVRTDRPGVVFLEIDGLAFPVLQRAIRDGHAPEMARWLAAGTHRLVEWETDLSSQTGASQAGILLGSNDDIPAFRWVEKETGTLMTCSAPRDCAEIERRHTNGSGLLTDGGTSRGNLLSGGAEEVILTLSRMQAERGPNPGYRAFFSNGYNVTRASVLFLGEIVLELGAATRQRRRDIQPRGHRGGTYPFLRAAVCVVLRDLIAFSVVSDVLRGRPAVYATFSSYDEVAHHSGLERHDTLEALRKVDKQIGRIARACTYAPRPYEIVVLSDHGQTQGATFKQRNGYGLDELVRRSVGARPVQTLLGGDENETALGLAFEEARGSADGLAIGRGGEDVVKHAVVVLGSGNLGLVYLMEESRRLTLEEIEARHPQLVSTLRGHPHVGFVLADSAEHGPVALGAGGTHYLRSNRVEGDDPLGAFATNAARHLARSIGFEHAPDLFVNSFYDPQVDEGCAFEELISFHGGLGGSQTRPFILAPAGLPLPDQPIVGAARVHEVLAGWRRLLNHGPGNATFRGEGASVEFALPQP
jgi:uncharacterized membrane protein YvlD (DUF360 family)